jgi:hypothetical protein
LAITASIIPLQVRGSIDKILGSNTDWRTWYPWLSILQGTNGFAHLSADWINKGWPQDPDSGYDYYILSGDSGMTGWDEHVAKLHERPIYTITLPEIYSNPTCDLVTHIPNIYYHKQILKLNQLNGPPKPKKIHYKASALTSRITQSKCVIFSALHQILGADCIVSLHNNFNPIDIHNWIPTDNKYIDELTEYFRKNWLYKIIEIEGDNNDPFSIMNPSYTQAAVNFTQESFHYSYMFHESKNQGYIYPGPFLTEKTFKCLLSQTAFIPVGQFRSYRWLETMGMEFDYGLDLTFDDESGNITRLSKLVSVIEEISQYSAQDLFQMTEKSTKHNFSVISTGEFFERCERANQNSIATLYEHLLD